MRKNSGVIFSTDMLIDRGYLVDKYATGEGRYKLTLSDDDRDALQRLCDHAVDPNRIFDSLWSVVIAVGGHYGFWRLLRFRAMVIAL